MGITALALGGWISVYSGICFLRSGLPETRPDHAPSHLGRIVTAAGYGLIVVGLAIFAVALHHHHHRIH